MSITQSQLYTRAIFKWSTTSLNSKFSFLTSCRMKDKKPGFYYNLPIAGERIIGSILFPRILSLWEMLTVSSWIFILVHRIYFLRRSTLSHRLH